MSFRPKMSRSSTHSFRVLPAQAENIYPFGNVSSAHFMTYGALKNFAIKY
jgi:hypothetical protein